MKILHKAVTIITAYLIFTCCGGCKKQDEFLNKVPDNALTVPKNLIDLTKILQDDRVLNTQDPGLGAVSSEEYYITDTYFASLTLIGQNEYTWAKDLYPNQPVDDWTNSYSQVYYANVVLDAVNTIKSSDTLQKSNIKGMALFFRSRAFYNLLSLFAPQYDSVSSETDNGIVLRLTSDLNAKSIRSSVESSYQQVIRDLLLSAQLLPDAVTYPTLPCKRAAYALLARVYLSMNSYSNAFAYADKCLKLNNSLTDFNSLNLTRRPIYKDILSEEIFRSTMESYNVSSISYRNVNPDFYNLYDPNDLRTKVFFYQFGSQTVFFGSYDTKSNGDYTGLANDELFLIRSECFARQGNAGGAMNDLNVLLAKRWKTGTYMEHTAQDASDALNQVLVERRKELVFRGLRWTDLRRLNKNPLFARTLTRTVNGLSYSLPPNDSRYVLPIPDDEIKLSGIQQNAR